MNFLLLQNRNSQQAATAHPIRARCAQLAATVLEGHWIAAFPANLAQQALWDQHARVTATPPRCARQEHVSDCGLLVFDWGSAWAKGIDAAASPDPGCVLCV